MIDRMLIAAFLNQREKIKRSASRPLDIVTYINVKSRLSGIWPFLAGVEFFSSRRSSIKLFIGFVAHAGRDGEMPVVIDGTNRPA